MRWIVILGAAALSLTLIGLIPLGIDASWTGGELALAARIWLFSLKLGKNPKREKPRKPRRKADKRTDAENSSQKKKRLSMPLIRILSENGLRVLSRIVSCGRTELLRIHFTSAFKDPALTATAYGLAGTAMEGLLAAGGGRIRRADLRADVDFDGTTPRVVARIRMTVRVGRLFGAGMSFGFRFLRDYLQLKKEEK